MIVNLLTTLTFFCFMAYTLFLEKKMVDEMLYDTE
jgi:hypothetical protein